PKRIFDSVAEEHCTGTVVGKAGIEAAEIGVGAVTMRKAVIDTGNVVANFQGKKTGNADRNKLWTHSAMKRLHLRISQYSGHCALSPTSPMKGDQNIQPLIGRQVLRAQDSGAWPAFQSVAPHAQLTPLQSRNGGMRASVLGPCE